MAGATIILQGACGADPETHTFDNGTSVTSVNVAVSQGYYDRNNQWVDQGTMWVRVRAVSAQAKHAITHARKGSKLIVQGPLEQRTYTRKDGTQGTSLEASAMLIGLVPRKDQPPMQQQAPQPPQQSQPAGNPWGNPQDEPWGI